MLVDQTTPAKHGHYFTPTHLQLARGKPISDDVFDVARLRSIDWCDRSEMLRSLPAVATLPAIAFLVVVHGTVLAGLAAIRLVRRKRYRANRCDQNRKQNFRVIFHSITLVRDVTQR